MKGVGGDGGYDKEKITKKYGQRVDKTTSKHIESSGSEKECLQNVGDSRLINLFVIIIPKLGLWILTAQSGITFLMATWLRLVGKMLVMLERLQPPWDWRLHERTG